MINYKSWKEQEQLITEAIELQILLETVQVEPEEVEELIIRAQNGDVEAVNLWPEKVSNLLTTSLLYMAGKYSLDKYQTQEVMQETLYRITRNIQGSLGETFHKGSTKAWLNSILQNTTMDYLRQHKRYWQTQFSSDTMESIPEEAPPDKRMEDLEQIEELRKIISKLPSNHEDVIKLKYIHGKKYDEIAQILGIPIGTVKSRLNGAIEKLREMKKD
jgi:RNA polymerase sigma-70 factor, ECF subfamily